MSSKVTGDAQSDAGPGGDKNQALPTEMVDNSAAEAGALTVAENPEPAAESGTARSESGPEAAEFVPEQPTGTMDAAGPGEGAASVEPPAGEDADYDEDEDREYRDELSDPAEPTELIAMTEPVDMAEPVERRRPRRGWQSALIALGFVVAAAAIVGGAIAIVGSLTHGFKKPVSHPLQEVRGLLAQDRAVHRPERADRVRSSPAPRRTTRRCSPRSRCRDRSGREPRR